MTFSQRNRNLFLLSAIVAAAAIAQSQTAMAAEIYLGDVFNYSNGSLTGNGTGSTFGGNDLLGGGPNGFVNNWTLSGPSTLGFDVQGGAVTFNNLVAPGALAGEITRDTNMPTNTTTTFGATFIQHGSRIGYESSVGFGNVRIGIQAGVFFMDDAAGNRHFGSAVTPDTPYHLVGLHRDNGGTQDTYLWVTQTYDDMDNGGTPNAGTADITSLGVSSSAPSFGTLSLSATADLDYSSNFATDRIFVDDLFVGSYLNSVSTIRLDVGAGGSTAQTGYEAWDLTSQFNSPATTNGLGDITFDLSSPNALSSFDLGAGTLIADGLMRDGVVATDELTLDIDFASGIGNKTGLKAYLTDAGAASADLVDVYLTVDGGAEQLVTTIDTTAFGPDVPGHVSMYFASATGDAAIRFAAQGGGDIYVNGFEVVPEPGTYAMMIIGMLGMGGYGYHRKRKNKKS